jgi:DNA recombination protein RmuC
VAVQILLGIIIILLGVLIYLFLKKTRIDPADVESAVSSAYMKLGLEEKVGMLTTYARDIRDNYKSFEQMLRAPTERGSFAEIALEIILSDQLPADMFGIRQRVLEGKIPDAYIKSTVGLICIDSKFPLDNYRKMIETQSPSEKEGFKKQFIRDMQGHLKKIADDYICPQKGSAEFAFAYIHSEGVYWFLVNEAFELLRDFTKKGVQVVSPLTLSHKIELIKAGVQAKKLSEEAEKVRTEIINVSKGFRDIDEKWKTFYQSHLKNLGNKAAELDAAYGKLRDEFEKVTRLSEEK